MDNFNDPLSAVAPSGASDRWFNRFYFNLHGSSLDTLVMVGAGVYPGTGVIDGFVVLVEAGRQRNHRFSTELAAVPLHHGVVGRVGPLAWETLAPLEAWRLQVGSNPIGVELDLTWRHRTDAFFETVTIENAGGSPSVFDHLVQSGRYLGTLTVDGVPRSVDGWWGHRDRSRGVRNVSGGQGLHVWFQAQFPDRCVSFLLGENRRNEVILLEGAVLHEGDGRDVVDAVGHDLDFDEGLDLVRGTVKVRTINGEVYDIQCDATAGGGFLAGAGYGGDHGRRRGRDWSVSDEFPLDGSVSPRTLSMPMTDRLTQFVWNGVVGHGIFEFAHTRSSSYIYRPTLDRV